MRPLKAAQDATFMDILEGEEDGGEMEELRNYVERLKVHVDTHVTELKREATIYRAATQKSIG